MGETKPEKVLNVELMPSETPAKFGEMSTTEASAPLETEPWSISEIVRSMTAIRTSHPEYAKPITNNPFSIKPVINHRDTQ
jgi:hypothetical protein